MKIIGVVYLFTALSAFSQEVNKHFICFSLGSIRHEVTTNSQTQKIKGLPTFDFLPEVHYTRFFNINSALTFGLQIPSLSTKYYINQNTPISIDNYTIERLTTNKSGYYKLYVSYNYNIKLNKFLALNFGLGPFLNISRVLGIDVTQTNNSVITSPNTSPVYFSNTFEVTKINRFGYGVIMYSEIQLKINKKFKTIFRVGYNKGLVNFNQIHVTSYIQNQQTDEAYIYSNGTGFLFSLGLTYPIFVKQIDRK